MLEYYMEYNFETDIHGNFIFWSFFAPFHSLLVEWWQLIYSNVTGAACRLYFDLEFKTELNPEKNGSKMVDTFIEVWNWKVNM